MSPRASRMWTVQEESFVAEARRRGQSYGVISRRVNSIFDRDRTPDAVKNRLARLLPRTEPIPSTVPPAWDPAEDELMLALWRRGACASEIADALNDNFGRCRNRCGVLSRIARKYPDVQRKAAGPRLALGAERLAL